MERRREAERLRLLELKKEAETQKATLEKSSRLAISKQVGEADAIFGTVTAQEVADLLQSNLNLEIDRRSINVPDISSLGTYKVEIRLHPEVTATVEIQVVPLR